MNPNHIDGFRHGGEVIMNINPADVALIAGLGASFFIIGGIVLLAVMILKGFALYKAARNGHKWWFILIFIINTVGILELVYLLAVAKNYCKDGVCKKCGESVEAEQKYEEKTEEIK